MRYELFEGIVIGGIIGFGVMLVRALTVDAPQSQTLLLAVVATVLCLVQIGLTARRIRRTPTNDPMRNEQHTLPSRRPRTRQDSFAQEEDHRWTGLAVEDELTQSLQEQQSQTPQAQHLADEGETVTETPTNGASLTPSNKNNAGDPPPKNGVSAPRSTSAHSVTPRNPVPTPVEDDE
jgi:hypothetical protein